jgi:hypothetical protein
MIGIVLLLRSAASLAKGPGPLAPGDWRARPFAYLAGSLAATVMLVGAATSGPARAQSAVHAPGVAPTHGGDFNGIWSLAGPNPLRGTPPYKPDWAKRYADTQAQLAAGKPVFDATEQCLPPGMPRFLLWLYPVEILMTPGQVTLLSEYFNETRRVFTDGRSHPPADVLEPTFRGHSVGHWEGSTLVVETVGIRPETVLSSALAPHSDKLRVVERGTMTGQNELKWEITLDDPIAFTAPYTFTIPLSRAAPEEEIREYVCEEGRAESKRDFSPIK